MTSTGAPPLCIGIDIGTARSAVAVWKDGRAELVPNAEGQLHTPSVVTFDAEGVPTVGSRAIDLGVRHPERSFHGFKHLFGLAGRTVAVDGRHWSPEDLAVLILGKLKADAEAHLERPIDRAVLTAPVAFALQQRASLVRAAGRAGIEVLRIVEEPAAAALVLTTQRRYEDHSEALVFDLGGGTLDISIVEMPGRDHPAADVVDVSTVVGDTHLGGADWDIRIAMNVAEDFEDRTGLTLAADPVAWERLVRAAEQAKIDLSSAESASITVPYVARDHHGHHHLEAEISRAQVELWTADLQDRCRALCRQALADISWTTPGEVVPLLVGGGSRLFTAAPLVEEVVGAPVDRRLDPDEAVAAGAALQAAIMNHQTTDHLLIAAISTSLDLRWDDQVEPMISRNTHVPTRKTVVLRPPPGPSVDPTLFLTQGDPAIGQVEDALATFDLGQLGLTSWTDQAVEVTLTVGAGFEIDWRIRIPSTGRATAISVDEDTAKLARRTFVRADRPPTSARRRVFVSYSRRDHQYVERLVARLAHHGLQPWWDRDVEVGEQSIVTLAQHLKNAGAVVVVMSPESERSTWVTRELLTAQDSGIPIFPLLLAGQKLFQVADLQYEDVTSGTMPSARFIDRVRDACLTSV